MSDLKALKEAFQKADQEYQFAMAAGNPGRLTLALENYRKTFAAYNKAMRQQFKKNFVSKYK